MTLVDIGARGDVRPEFAALAPISRLVACEPDAAEAAALRERLAVSGAWAAVTVITEALWPEPGMLDLYITKAPGLTSARLPNVQVTSRFANAGAFEVERVVTVPAITLDEASAQYGFRDASLLKLDTQGTELDILRSGESLLDGVLGVYLEVEFQPLYTGQAVFSDVDAFLRGKGFELFDLHRSWQRFAGFREDVFSRRQLTWAHCLFLRSPIEVPQLGETPALRFVALAAAYQHFDAALLVAQAAGLDDDVVSGVLEHAQRMTKWVTRRSEDRAALLAPSAKDSRR
jgi:FkbM family methyltransferase